MKNQKILVLAMISCVLSGCAVGPDYRKPAVSVPLAWDAQGAERDAASPADKALPARWWAAYGDPTLDRLVELADTQNQDLLVAEARLRQADAALRGSQAGLFPTLSGTLARTRTQDAGNAAVRKLDRLALSAGWEIDLWGRVRRQIEAGRAEREATAAELAAARLSIQTTLAQSYFTLRINDAQQRLLQKTLAAYQRSFDITRNRHAAGIASQAEVAQAETQLRSTEAQAIELNIERARLEHAIATLTGRLPDAARLPATDELPAPPAIPLALPSTLLENRPDIAAAERRVAAANARIGVARAAFFPEISLSASGGFQNAGIAHLLTLPNRYWSLGPILAISLLDGGRRAAADDEAIAEHDSSVASYRQTVLQAFREVEDELSTLRILEQEKTAQLAASAAARRFQTQTDNQYLAGTVSFLNVATAQAAALNAERSSLDLLGRQLVASVALVRALGGSPWQDRAYSDLSP